MDRDLDPRTLPLDVKAGGFSEPGMKEDYDDVAAL